MINSPLFSILFIALRPYLSFSLIFTIFVIFSRIRQTHQTSPQQKFESQDPHSLKPPFPPNSCRITTLSTIEALPSRHYPSNQPYLPQLHGQPSLARQSSIARSVIIQQQKNAKQSRPTTRWRYPRHTPARAPWLPQYMPELAPVAASRRVRTLATKEKFCELIIRGAWVGLGNAPRERTALAAPHRL